MTNFNTIDEILDFAIGNEQEAVDFYNELSLNASNQEMADLFLQFAKEEMSHKKRLTTIKERGTLLPIPQKAIQDLKISDYVVDVEVKPNMSYEEALVLAMKKEKAAFKLYTDLSKKAPDEASRKLFDSLAIEESKHKLRFELEYDDTVLREN